MVGAARSKGCAVIYLMYEKILILLPWRMSCGACFCTQAFMMVKVLHMSTGAHAELLLVDGEIQHSQGINSALACQAFAASVLSFPNVTMTGADCSSILC